MGRNLVLVFFEDADAGMVRRVDRGLVGMKQELLTLAELLQTLGGIVVPADPERTAAQQNSCWSLCTRASTSSASNAPWNLVLLMCTSTAWMMLCQQRQHSAMSLLQIRGPKWHWPGPCRGMMNSTQGRPSRLLGTRAWQN